MALMDGCGSLSVLWRILLPRCAPAITVSLFAFLAA
jgi:ABC-type glycerol-3-phosphate transport system permease component